jgi:hypothetical protein
VDHQTSGKAYHLVKPQNDSPFGISQNKTHVRYPPASMMMSPRNLRLSPSSFVPVESARVITRTPPNASIILATVKRDKGVCSRRSEKPYVKKVDDEYRAVRSVVLRAVSKGLDYLPDLYGRSQWNSREPA